MVSVTESVPAVWNTALGIRTTVPVADTITVATPIIRRRGVSARLTTDIPSSSVHRPRGSLGRLPPAGRGLTVAFWSPNEATNGILRRQPRRVALSPGSVVVPPLTEQRIAVEGDVPQRQMVEGEVPEQVAVQPEVAEPEIPQPELREEARIAQRTEVQPEQRIDDRAHGEGHGQREGSAQAASDGNGDAHRGGGAGRPG